MERAVDAEADAEAVCLGLDVDVGGAVAEGLGEQQVDDLDHRGVGAERDGQGGGGRLLAVDDRALDRVVDPVENGVVAIQGALQRAPARQPGEHRLGDRPPHRCDLVGIGGVGDRAVDHPQLVDEEGEGAQAARRLPVQQVEGVVLGDDLVEIHRVVAELLRQGPDHLPLGDAGVDQQLADRPAITALAAERGAHRPRVGGPTTDQQLAEWTRGSCRWARRPVPARSTGR